MENIARFYIFLCIGIMMACTGKKPMNADNARTDYDTIPNEPAPQMVEPLPDTTYLSATVVKYVIENKDTLPHPLDNFDDLYERNDRVMTFRKNLMRNADFSGRLTTQPCEIEIAWRFDTPENIYTTWGGTGQPLYVHWTNKEMKLFRRDSPALTEDFGEEEVMVGSLCGRAFFLIFNTGRQSRLPLELHNIVKGTMSLDPEYMNLYVGQGASAGTLLGCEAFDLLSHRRTFFMNDASSWRKWQAFDSSPVVVGG